MSCASCLLAKPVMRVPPEEILLCIVGAINTFLSRTIATLFPILLPVKRLHLIFPSLVISKLTIQLPTSSLPNSEINAFVFLISPPDIADFELTRYNFRYNSPLEVDSILSSHNI